MSSFNYRKTCKCRTNQPLHTSLIGDIIESRPPRRKQVKESSLISSVPISPSSSTSEVSDQDVRPLLSAPKRRAMKTRTLNSSSMVSNSCTNGTGNRRNRIHSSENGPLSPRTRSSIKQEIDDEVSFIDPVLADGHDPSGENLKKKRKSVNEKFLEDNTEYYGFQVLSTKLRSSGEASTSTSSSFQNVVLGLLHEHDHEHEEKDDTKHRQRHKSASDVNGTTTSSTADNKLRKRTASSSSGFHFNANNNDSSSSKKKKVKGRGSKDEDEDSLDEDKRKSSVVSMSALSPTSRKRRSELDKLLEAGSSSFHFETAREATNRINGETLGPIHVDVDSSFKVKNGSDDMESDSDIDSEVFKPAAAKKKKKTEQTEATQPPRKPSLQASERLLQQAQQQSSSSSPSTSSSSSTTTITTALPPPATTSTEKSSPSSKKRGNPSWVKKKLKTSKTRPVKKGRPSKTGHKVRKAKTAAEEEALDKEAARREMLEKYLPSSMFEELELNLSEVDGVEADVEAMQFSFERTPFRESWFSTYSRQDQGEEILYYPEPRAFLLPYEMPISTFYPRKDGPGGRGEKSKRKYLLNEPASTMDSLAASGTATPTEEDPESSTAATAAEDDPWARVPLPPPQPKTPRGRRGRPADPQQLTNALKRTKESDQLAKLGPKVSLAFREFSRKSPRGHASTRSLISELNDQTDSTDDIDTDSNLIVANSKSVTPAHLIDECSNDSTASRFSVSSEQQNPGNPVVELDLATLDEFLRMPDADLATGDATSPCTTPTPDSSNDKKKPKRRSSDKRHHHKHHHRANKDTMFPMDDPMDRLVACNVDEVLLDCLEDELPSVTLDGALPGSETLELVEKYNECDAMSLCSRKMRPRPFLRTPSTSSTSTLDAKEKPPNDLNREEVKLRPQKLEEEEEPEMVEAKEEEDSSSDDDVISVASSEPIATIKKKKKTFKIPAKTKTKLVGKVQQQQPPHLVVPKLQLKVIPKSRKVVVGTTLNTNKKTLVVKKAVTRGPKKASPTSKGRGGRSNAPSKKFVVDLEDDEDEDEVDEVDDSDDDSHEVFQLSPSSSKNLKLIVRKKRVCRVRQKAAPLRKPIRVPIRRKKVEDDNSSEDDSDDDDDVSGDGSVEEVEDSVGSEDEVLARGTSRRLKATRQSTLPRRKR